MMGAELSRHFQWVGGGSSVFWEGYFLGRRGATQSYEIFNMLWEATVGVHTSTAADPD